MNVLLWPVIIFPAALVLFTVAAWLVGRPAKPTVTVWAGPEPAPLPRAGYFSTDGKPCWCYWCNGRVDSHGPDAVALYRQQCAEAFNTGPLLLLSDKMAANQALEREIREMGEAADRTIGPVKP